MKKMALVILVAALALPLTAETWKSVTLMDGMCAAKPDKMADPDGHERSCALSCSKSGFGAIIDGKFVKFDSKGNKLAAKALDKTKKKDHIRATVKGDMKDDVIHVSALTLE